MISLFWLDETDLNPGAFRLLIHYWCESRNNQVTARLGRVSVTCRMSTKSVKAAETELIARGLLERQGKRSFLLTLPEETITAAPGSVVRDARAG